MDCNRSTFKSHISRSQRTRSIHPRSGSWWSRSDDLRILMIWMISILMISGSDHLGFDVSSSWGGRNHPFWVMENDPFSGEFTTVSSSVTPRIRHYAQRAIRAILGVNMARRCPIWDKHEPPVWYHAKYHLGGSPSWGPTPDRHPKWVNFGPPFWHPWQTMSRHVRDCHKWSNSGVEYGSMAPWPFTPDSISPHGVEPCSDLSKVVQKGVPNQVPWWISTPWGKVTSLYIYCRARA